MKLSIVHLRVAMMVLNVSLALGLAYYYYRSMWAGREADSPVAKVKIVPPEEFRNVRTPASTDKNRALNLANSAAANLSPERPVERTAVSGTDVPKTEEKPGGGDAASEAEEGGPLDEEWEYVWCIYDASSPVDTLVALRKKQDAPAAGRGRAGSSATSRSTRRSTTSSRRPTNTSRSRMTAASSDTLYMHVKDRRYTDEELGLDFYIDSADMNRFVYAVDRNGKLEYYALRRKYSTQYEELGSTKGDWGIGPKKSEEEGGEEVKKEEEEKKFVVRDVHYEDQKEQYWRDKKLGKKAGEIAGRKTKPRSSRPTPPPNLARPAAPAVSSGAQPAEKEKEDAAKTAAGAGEAGAADAGAGGPITDPEEREKALKKLQEETANLPPEARKEIQDALTQPPAPAEGEK